MALKEGTKVSWLVDGHHTRGSGVTVSDERNGLVMVSVNSMFGEPNPGYHAVIECAVTWLKVEEEAPAAPQDNLPGPEPGQKPGAPAEEPQAD